LPGRHPLHGLERIDNAPLDESRNLFLEGVSIGPELVGLAQHPYGDFGGPLLEGRLLLEESSGRLLGLGLLPFRKYAAVHLVER
jgi:hypothetical protein